MSHIYEHEFEIVFTEQVPETKNAPIAMGGHLEGCRIGFDAGGSDRKVSAVIDGETVFSEEVVWFPKVTEDPPVSLRRDRSCLQICRRAYAAGGCSGYLLCRDLHQQPYHERIPVPQRSQGPL